ncbi:MAG: universal stress protein [Acidimicrobiales bacterium]
MERILAGVDGSAVAARALRWAGALAGSLGAELHVATVLPPAARDLPAAVARELRDARRRLLEGEWCAELDPALERRTYLLEGHPGAVLAGLAEELAVGLVAVGTEGHSGVFGVGLGSTALHLAHHLAVALLVVGPRSVEPPLERIVVGLDGSVHSAAAAEAALSRAAATGASLTAAYVYQPPLEWTPPTDPTSWRRRAAAELEEWAAPLRGRGVEVSTRYLPLANPVLGLGDVVERVDADLLVVGARGRGGFLGLRVGGVSLQALRHARGPVLLAPAAPGQP